MLAAISSIGLASDSWAGGSKRNNPAKDKASYLAIGKPGVAQAQDAPPGQIIVKESWLPKPAIASTISVEAATPAVAPALVADIKHTLFIMVKVDPKTPDSDDGWIYEP